jgi:hypothetical protein
MLVACPRCRRRRSTSLTRRCWPRTNLLLPTQVTTPSPCCLSNLNLLMSSHSPSSPPPCIPFKSRSFLSCSVHNQPKICLAIDLWCSKS